MPLLPRGPRIKESEVLAAQRRHRAQHTGAGEAAAAQVAACLDSLQAEAQVRLGTAERHIPCPVYAHLSSISCHSLHPAEVFGQDFSLQGGHCSLHSLLS